MAGHSRLKDGVASARLCPAIHVFLPPTVKTWMPGTRPGMTVSGCHNPICLDARSFMISSVPPPIALTFTSR